MFAKACEMFILELTLRSWYQTEEFKRRTLQVGSVCAADGVSVRNSEMFAACSMQRSDVSAAVKDTEIFDFLIDTVSDDKKVNASAACLDLCTYG